MAHLELNDNELRAEILNHSIDLRRPVQDGLIQRPNRCILLKSVLDRTGMRDSLFGAGRSDRMGCRQPEDVDSKKQENRQGHAERFEVDPSIC